MTRGPCGQLDRRRGVGEGRSTSRRSGAPRRMVADGERTSMHYQLSDSARETALRAARTMFPHDMLPDEDYMAVVRQIEVEAGNNEEVARQIEQGIAGLDGSGSFGALDADAQLEALKGAEGSPFFELLKATAVVALYDQPSVWKAL